jgi:uncharacterized membrane protein YdjX (TVP38/TMEM64 family)
MKSSFKVSPKEIAGGLSVALLFLGTSYASERIATVLERFIGEGDIAAMITYIFAVILDVMVPLATTLPLVPVAVALWGKVLAALLTIIGWILSAMIAFTIARRFGAKLLEKFKILAAVRQFGDMIPRQNLWWAILCLAIIGVPVDFLSYSIGLFTGMRLKPFILAYTIGVIPFGFFIAYTATLPIIYQTYIVAFMLIVWFLVYAKLRGNQPTEEKTTPPKPTPSVQDIRQPPSLPK